MTFILVTCQGQVDQFPLHRSGYAPLEEKNQETMLGSNIISLYEKYDKHECA